MHVLLIISLHLATQPSSDWSTKDETIGHCAGWSTLSHLVPFYYIDKDSVWRWYWLWIGASLMLFSIREIDWLKRAFESKTAQCEYKAALNLVVLVLMTYRSRPTFFCAVPDPRSHDSKLLRQSVFHDGHQGDLRREAASEVRRPSRTSE